MKKTSYRTLAEAVSFNGLKDVDLNSVSPNKFVRKLTKEELIKIVKEEFGKVKDVEDVEVEQDKNWADAELEKEMDWVKTLDIKEIFNIK